MPSKNKQSSKVNSGKVKAKTEQVSNKSAYLVLALAGCTISLLYLFFKNAPKPNSESCEMISVGYMIKGVLPKVLGGRNDKLGTVKQLWQCATQYKQKNPNTTVAAFSIVYIALQTFAIPGPIVLSILSGALYPFVNAQVLVAACATTGASLCFMLSYFFGRGVLHRLMPEMLDKFQKKIRQNEGNLFYYLLFLRITPLLPNWFVNIGKGYVLFNDFMRLACPMVNVEFKYFFLATLIGLLPANFFHVSTGATLNQAASNHSGSNTTNFIILFVLQFVALLPTLFKSKLQEMDKKK